jgi:hypothetical protein
MSVLAVLLYAGGTTLTAAIVTLFTVGMAAGRMERRSRKRRYRQLEGPVPGRRGLSDVALKAEADGVGLQTGDDGLVHPPMPASPEPAVQAPRAAERTQGLPATASAPTGSVAAASAAQGTPPPSREKKPDPVSADREPRVAAHRETRAPVRKDAAGPVHPEPKAPAPTQGQQPQPNKRKPSVSIVVTTPETAPETAMPAAASPDAIADLDKLLEELQIPADALAGDAAVPADITLDLFAGMDETQTDAGDLEKELDGIDGGGLPAPSRNTPQKSRL